MNAKIIGLNDIEVHFLIPSSRDGVHNVVYNRVTDSWTCTCEHYEYRGAFCKHMEKAQELLKELNSQIQDCFTTKIYNHNQLDYIMKQEGK